MKKVLFLTTRSPYGIHDGKNLRIYNYARILAKQFSVDLLCQEEAKCPPELHNPFSEKYIFKLKRPKMILGLVSALLKGESMVNRYCDPEIKSFIEKNADRYSLIYCTYVHSAVNALGCRLPKVVDLVDAISLHYREATDLALARRLAYRLDYSKVLELEAKVIKDFDLCLITTIKEKDFLCSNLDIDSKERDRIKVLHNGVELPEFGEDDATACEKANSNVKVVGFLGSMDYYPNVTAAGYLVKEILPACKHAVGDLKCMIIGANPTHRVLKLGEIEGVTVTGFVDDLASTMACIDVMVLPMRTASGLQNKLITSMAHGKAVVTATRAVFDAEKLKDGYNLMVADSKDDFIRKTIFLLSNPALRKEMGRNAREYVRNELSWDKVETSLISLLKDLKIEAVNSI